MSAANPWPACDGTCGRKSACPASCLCVLPERLWSKARVVQVRCSCCSLSSPAIWPENWKWIRVVCPGCSRSAWLGVEVLSRLPVCPLPSVPVPEVKKAKIDPAVARLFGVYLPAEPSEVPSLPLPQSPVRLPRGAVCPVCGRRRCRCRV